jgi:hypothetical protein
VADFDLEAVLMDGFLFPGDLGLMILVLILILLKPLILNRLHINADGR